MKEKPKCYICGEPALMVIYDSYFCGKCVAEYYKKEKGDAVNRMKEVLKK